MFIDTLKLLKHESVGKSLLEDFAERIRSRFAAPDVILIPGRRERAKVLGTEIAKLLGRTRDVRPKLVLASRGRGGWLIQERDRTKLTGARVLVVDTAVGQAKTIDQVCTVASRFQPAGLGAAVLVSRIPEAGEAALDLRLPDGFVSLFHLPIQPFVIRGSRDDLCPICSQKSAVNAATASGRAELFEDWGKWLSRLPVRNAKESHKCRRRKLPKQLSLFPSETNPFLSQCSPRVAGGVTLHSLSAAQNDGMAALALPELLGSEVKPRTKVAMVEHLPPRVLEWSGEGLERELEEVLATSDKPGLWRAAANVMARENYSQWYEHLGEILEHCNRLQREPSPVFWSSLAWNAYAVGKVDADAVGRMRETLRQLLKSYRGTAAEQGLERVLKALT